MVNDLISAVGVFAKTGFGSVHTTLSVSPVTFGDAMVFGAVVDGTGRNISTITGGGCANSGSGTYGAWTRVGSPVQFTSPNVATQSMEFWLGTVTTTGSSTITVTFTSAGSTNTALCCQEMTSGGRSATIWSADGTVASTNNSTASTTITYPSRTPSAINRAYIGLGYAGGTGSTSGATAGYTVQLDQNNNPFIYNPSVSTVQTPTSVQTSAKSNTIAMLIKADNPTSQFLPFFT